MTIDSTINAKLASIDAQIKQTLQTIRNTQSMLLERSIIPSYVSSGDVEKSRKAAETHADACFNDADRRNRILRSIQAVQLSSCSAPMKHALYRSICLL